MTQITARGRNAKPLRRSLILITVTVAAIVFAVVGTRTYNAFSLLNSGQQIDIGGRELFIRCEGSGTPTILLEHGLGSSGTEWQTVQGILADTNRVCFTSRAGMGFSDPPSVDGIRTANDAVDDLALLLAGADVSGPYIVVGHSFGGYVVRLFADQHPDDVAGMVLVDSTHEDQAALLRQQLSPKAWGEAAGLFGTENPERIDFEASAVQVGAIRDLGDLPLVVLEADQQHTESTAAISQQTAEEIDNVMAALWPELQTGLAALSTDSTHVVVERSGHFIQTDQPDAVVAAVRSLLAGG